MSRRHLDLLIEVRDAIRRTDSDWCSQNGQEKITPEHLDDVLARVEYSIEKLEGIQPIYRKSRRVYYEKLKFVTGAQLIEDGIKEDERREKLAITHIDHPRGFRFTEHSDGDWWEIYWGGYNYDFENERLNTAEKLLDFLAHILEKDWDGVTGEKVSNFIRSVDSRNKISRHHTPSCAGDAVEERAKMTPRLRFQTLRKSGFRCTSCGLGPEHGAILHADHIVPISKGGKTEDKNLRALCSSCNFGKGADL
jgi:hypothetical protein